MITGEDQTLEESMEALSRGQSSILSAIKVKPDPPTVRVEPPIVNVAAPEVKVAAPNVTVEPTIRVESPVVHVASPTVNVPPANVEVRPTIQVHNEQPKQCSWRFVITKRDRFGKIEEFTATPT